MKILPLKNDIFGATRCRYAEDCAMVMVEIFIKIDEFCIKNDIFFSRK